MTIEFAGLSETGPVRDHNEDFIGHSYPDEPQARADKGALVLVCDGVGGSAAGEVASREAVSFLVRQHQEAGVPLRPERFLKGAVEAANLHINDLGTRPESRRTKTTLAALLLHGEFAYVAHAGDTRIYVVRGGQAQLLTRDHSEVNELVRLGIITPDEARHHPRRNIITRSLGAELMLPIEVRVEKVRAEDRFVLLTDGVWEPVEDADIARLVETQTPQAACEGLIQAAIENGSSDNLSVQVVRVIAPGEGAPEAARKGLLGRIFGR